MKIHHGLETECAPSTIFPTLGLPALCVLFSLVALAASPAIYCHASSSGLPSDVQVLNASLLPPSDLYAGTWGQGIYRSIDQGTTWVTTTPSLTLPMYVRDGLAVNPVTPTVLYAGDYYGGLFGAGV